MNIIEIFTHSNINDVALIIRCLLDRTPIVIFGEDLNQIEEIINDLSNLIPFRNVLTFFNDFVDESDYQDLLENEEYDLQAQRTVFIGFPQTSDRIIGAFHSFKAWIIGFEQNSENSLGIDLVRDRIFLFEKQFLLVKIKNSSIETQLEGKSFPNYNLNFEKWVYQDAIKRTETSIEKMKRVISKGLKNEYFHNDDFQNIMNFSLEEKELQENIVKKEILNFYEACKRSLSILNRMNVLETMGHAVKISSRTLLATVAYKKASMHRILQFICSEWYLTFNFFINSNKQSNFSDTFESLWG